MAVHDDAAIYDWPYHVNDVSSVKTHFDAYSAAPPP